MEKDKFVCRDCGSESSSPGPCAACKIDRTAVCGVCGNPVVGEHIGTQE